MEENTTIETSAPDWDNWDDIDLSDIVDDQAEEEPAEPAEADQPETEEAAEAETTEPEETVEEPTADQPFVLKHLGESREYSREEVTTLAQKGLDYDRIRTRLEQMTAERDANSAAESEAQSFLEEMAKASGISVSELMDRTRAQALAEKEKIDFSVALGRVQNLNEARRLQKEKAQMEQSRVQQTEEETKRQKAIEDFAQAYPDVKATDIPRPVWEEFSKTGNLVTAYRAEENRQLKAQIESLNKKLSAKETNEKNKGRSTGSQKSAGTQEPMDPIMADWYKD